MAKLKRQETPAKAKAAPKTKPAAKAVTRKTAAKPTKRPAAAAPAAPVVAEKTERKPWTRLTDERLEVILRGIQTGLGIDDACLIGDVSPEALVKLRKRDPDVDFRVRKALAQSRAFVVTQAVKLLRDGDGPTIRYWLDRRNVHFNPELVEAQRRAGTGDDVENSIEVVGFKFVPRKRKDEETP